MADDPSSIAELATHECLALLRTASVGRLAVSRPTHPEVFPVNFVVDHGAVMFRTAAGTKLDAISQDHDVTFEADGYDAANGEAWSVVVKGQASEVAGVHDLVAAVDLPLFPWHAAPKQRIVRILPEEMTGRRFHVAPGSSPG
jgi:nitroimidazol reductase NimA-like FMN-containing flavoprotein (pyridoxamine 5'-phosphate oxidase superfamily)